MMKKVIRITEFLVMAGLLCLFTGCVSMGGSEPVATAPPAPVCPLPSGYNLERAFDQAQATLSNPACGNKFDTIFNILVDIAKGDPKMENRKLFEHFLIWCKNEGIISKMMAKEKFQQYFTTKFYCLPKTYPVANYCSRLENLCEDLRAELALKKVGYIEVCGNQAEYQKAQEDYRALKEIMTAACEAIADRKGY